MNHSIYLNETEMETIKKAADLERRSINNWIIKCAIEESQRRINKEKQNTKKWQ